MPHRRPLSLYSSYRASIERVERLGGKPRVATQGIDYDDAYGVGMEEAMEHARDFNNRLARSLEKAQQA